MGIATITSAQAVAIMKACGRSTGLSVGMEIKNPWKPLKSHWTVSGHDRMGEIEAYMEIPSQYNLVDKG